MSCNTIFSNKKKYINQSFIVLHAYIEGNYIHFYWYLCKILLYILKNIKASFSRLLNELNFSLSHWLTND